MQLKYIRRDTRAARTSWGSVEMRHWFNTTSGHSESGIRESVAFVVTPREACTFDRALRRFVWPLQDLISIATDKANAIHCLSLHPVPKEHDQPDRGGSVTAHFASLRTKPKDYQPIYAHDMLYCLPDLGD